MSDQPEREIRAARNQAMFRAINEKLREVNAALGSISETYVIACECADLTCIQTLRISPSAYETIRSLPNRFAVREDHVYDTVEDVVSVDDGYVVVEKRSVGAGVVEATDPRTQGA